MKTDNIDLFNYSKESIINHGYKIQYSTNDLDCLEEDNIMTEYEKKFYSQGVKINKLIAIKASKEEKSCGCIIIDNNHKVLLINQKNGNFWGFPKGHIEPNESEIETAKRETKEEVGIEVEILKDKRYETHYLKRGEIDKTTIYFLAIPKTNKIIIQESEINDAKWVKIDEAIELLSFEETKEILKTLKEDQ